MTGLLLMMVGLLLLGCLMAAAECMVPQHPPVGNHGNISFSIGVYPRTAMAADTGKATGTVTLERNITEGAHGATDVVRRTGGPGKREQILS